MSNPLKDIADDLSRFLTGVEKPPKPEIKPLTAESEEVTAHDLVRTTFDYVLSQIGGKGTASVLGEALMLGASAAAHDVGREPETVRAAMLGFLEEITEAARTHGSTPDPA